MKKYSFLAFLIPFLSLSGQHQFTIQTSLSQSSSLTFPVPITKVTLENKEDFVFVEKNNVLFLSCLVDKPIHTKLVVETKEKERFSFLLENVKKPNTLAYFIGENSKDETKEIQKQACEIALTKKSIFSPLKEKKRRGLLSYIFKQEIQTHNAKIKLTLFGVFIHHNKMYFLLEIENKSLFDFCFHSLSIETKAKKKIKKTSLTLKKIPISNRCQNLQKIPLLSSLKEVLVVDNFSLEKNEELSLEILESGQANRHLKLTIPSRALDKAQLLKP